MTGKFGPGRQDDYELWSMILVPIVIGGGLLWLWSSWPQVARWLADHQVLTRTEVLIPLGGGTGLDIPRAALLAAILISLTTLTGFVLRMIFRPTEAEQARR
jgi:hypothetical protein